MDNLRSFPYSYGWLAAVADARSGGGLRDAICSSSEVQIVFDSLCLSIAIAIFLFVASSPMSTPLDAICLSVALGTNISLYTAASLELYSITTFSAVPNEHMQLAVKGSLDFFWFAKQAREASRTFQIPS